MQNLKKLRRNLTSKGKWKLRLVFWGCAIVIGATAALFSLAGAYTDGLYHKLHAHSPWVAYTVTPLGLALIAWLTRSYFIGTEGSGIPHMLAATSSKDSKLRSAVLSLRIAISKIFLTCGGLLCGASIGTVGPMIHVGASIMYSARRFFPVRNLELHRILIIAGGAAGIAAAFNNPLAGILFAIEELKRHFRDRTRDTLIIAVVLAGLTSLAILGRYSFFGISSTAMPATLEVIPGIILIAVVGGLLGGLFSQSLIYSGNRLAPLAIKHPVLLALACGLVLSLLGFLSNGDIYGTGYAESQRLMAGGEPGTGYVIMKLLATVVSYLSGIPGGIFTPSLSIGAGLGAEFARFFPHIPVETLLLLGMVSYLTGVVQTPITAFIIVMEMTNSATMALPLMAAALIAKSVSHLVCPRPIYQVMAEAWLSRYEQNRKLAG